MPINYKGLLEKYMAWVRGMADTDFVDRLGAKHNLAGKTEKDRRSLAPFSQEEQDRLKLISKQQKEFGEDSRK